VSRRRRLTRPVIAAAVVATVLAGSAVVWAVSAASGPPAGLVAVVRADPSGSSLLLRFVCSGLATGNGLVVTAAHCVGAADASRFEIVADVTDLCERNGSSGVPVGSVIAVDSAADVLWLDVPGVNPFRELDTADPTPGDAVAWGWGGRSGPSCQARSVYLTLMADSDCRTERDRFGLPATYFCATPAGGGPNTCGGDSGGPILQAGRLVGITSAGAGCGQRSVGFGARAETPPGR